MSPTPRFAPHVEPFFHAATNTFSYVVHDGEGSAVIVDPVLDFDPASASTRTTSADAMLEFVQTHRLQVAWILETHAHADHLSAAGYLHERLGAPMAIGRGITSVQRVFKEKFGLDDGFVADGRQFDRLLDHEDTLVAGRLEVRAIATPGHTSDGMTYLIGDAAFVGDTLFAPETGTARTDFPGGDARQLFASIHSILALPADTRLFLCHDYPPEGRAPEPLSSIGAQRERNVHVHAGVDEAAFVAMRQARDATLPVPRLILPALQVNIRGGRLPPPEADGTSYLRLPLNRLGGGA